MGAGYWLLIGVGVIGIGFAVVFAVGAVLTYRGSRLLVPLVGVLVLVEVAALPTFTRDTPSDWIIQVPSLIVGLVGLSGLGTVCFAELRTRPARAAT